MPRSDDDEALERLEGELIPRPLAGVPQRRRFMLTSARGVRRELSALYHGMRNNEIDTDTARTGAFVLRCLLESLRVDEIEQRLTKLENGR